MKKKMISIAADDFIRLCSIAESIANIAYEWAPDMDDCGDDVNTEINALLDEAANIKANVKFDQ